MSLIKYTPCINSLLSSLKISGLWCIRRIPSTLVGYADDRAACCLSGCQLEGVMQTVNDHGRTWRYEYIAGKSGIVVLGESQVENDRNKVLRSFSPCDDRVRGRVPYDRVGVRECLFQDDVSGVEERLSKAKRALHAVSGIGIRRNGLSIATYCVIFWSIVVPIALCGSELWIMSDESIRLIEKFQNYIGKRMQRLFPRIPNVCAYFGLGLIRLERLIEIKKIIFIRSILNFGETGI